MPNDNRKEKEILLVKKINRIPRDEVAKGALLIFSLLCSIAVGVCFIVNFAHDKGITWSAFVLSSVGYVWLTALPLFLAKKHKFVFSLAILPFTTLPFLYLLDILTPNSSWFAPLALPITVTAVAGIWICAAIVRVVKVNKWILSAVLVILFGTCIHLTVTGFVSRFTGEATSPLSHIITIFSLVVTAGLLAIIGYIQSIVKKYGAKERDARQWHKEDTNIG